MISFTHYSQLILHCSVTLCHSLERIVTAKYGKLNGEHYREIEAKDVPRYIFFQKELLEINDILCINLFLLEPAFVLHFGKTLE